MHEWYHHDRIKIPVSRFAFRLLFLRHTRADKFVVFTGYENMRRALFTSLIFNEMQQQNGGGGRRKNEQAQIYKILQEFLLK